MTYHIVYDQQEGTILHIHRVYDAQTGEYVRQARDEVLESLADFFPEPERVDVLTVETVAPVDVHGMRVNPADKRLEAIPIEPSDKE